MFLEKLRSSVNMPETGDAGFEGLVATLLTALTADRFYVARSGDQPADAIASAADIAMQAKRYAKSTVVETNFEGEFAKACRLIPSLDCYVFAVTRQTGQLRLPAKELQNREGVDIVLLGFDTIDSELPALCVTFWQRVKHFTKLSDLRSDFADWAAEQATEPNVAAIISRLREELTVIWPQWFGDGCRQILETRFGIDATSRRAVRFPIDLPSAVRREKPHALLQDWWIAKKAKAALLVGDEGTGKSVVAAAFCREVSEGKSALVLWLDSADWSGRDPRRNR